MHSTKVHPIALGTLHSASRVNIDTLAKRVATHQPRLGTVYPTPRAAAAFIIEHGAKRYQSTIEQSNSHPFEYERPKFHLPKILWLFSAAVPLASWALLCVAFGIDRADPFVEERDKYTFTDMVWSIFHPNYETSYELINTVMNSMSMIFTLLLTVIGVTLQLSANRFSNHVTGLFFRDRVIHISLAFAIMSNLFCFWVELGISERFTPYTAIVMIVVMVSLQLLLLFPFFAYLFYFLDPSKIINKITADGVRAATRTAHEINLSADKAELKVDRDQVKAILAIEHLVAACNLAIKKNDKNIAAEIVDALCSFTLQYEWYKDKLSDDWFRVRMWIRHSPDFLTLSDDSIQSLSEKKIWLEWKVLRQYQVLFNEALANLKDIAYHLAINTKIMGEFASRRNDIHTLDLCAKFFNTYLRAGINANDIRNVYNTLYQYRMMGEFVIKWGMELRKELANAAEPESIAKPQQKEKVLRDIARLEHRAVRIAKFLRYYSFTCLQRRVFFLVEVIAHDIRSLCETAFALRSPIHDKLLIIFLTVDDQSENEQGEKRMRGVLKAQVHLAASYLTKPDGVEYARRIFEEINAMEGESLPRLYSIYQELQNITQKEFWEVSERETNLNYMSDEQKAQLPVFFSWFKGFRGEDQALTPRAQKRREQQRDLQDFD